MFEYSSLPNLDNDYKDTLLSNEEIYFTPIFNNENRVNLNVPFEKKEDAKFYGAQWDPYVQTWFFNENTGDKKALKKYMPKNGKAIKFKRTPSERLTRILSPQQIFDIQNLLQLSNSEFASFLFISEETLVKIKKGEEEIPEEPNRILNVIKVFNNHYRHSPFDELFSTFNTEKTQVKPPQS